MKTAKIYFPNSEIRRLSACDKSFDDLVSFAAQTMPENNLEFSYLDNEHDFVVFTSQEEWQEAQKYHAGMKKIVQVVTNICRTCDAHLCQAQAINKCTFTETCLFIANAT